MAKTGIAGTGTIAVPLLALTFGSKASTGLILPIFIFADFFAIHYYHRSANWFQLRRLLPFALVGIVIGTGVGDLIDDDLFRELMAGIILFCLAIMIWQEKQKELTVPGSTWFIAIIGILGGFTTMIGNLAGPVMVVYLLAMRLPKNQMIGTAAWFFLFINIIKVPFHVLVWETINLDTFLMGATLIPAVALGALMGVRLTSLFPEQTYRWFVIVMTGVGAIALLHYA
jgi:uncharacterized membrane protein YfcA